MRVKIVCTKFDLLDHTSEVLCDAQGILRNDTLIYKENSEENALHEITFSEDELILKRKAEITSETHLLRGAKGKAKVFSPYGLMEMETFTMALEKNDELWSAEYKILNGSEAVTYQKLVWQIRGINE